MPVYSELLRTIAVRKIGKTPFKVTIEATERECRQIAERLHIPFIDALKCDYILRQEKDGRIKADGRLEVQLKQQCVVSLELFSTTVKDSFTVYFVLKSDLQEDNLIDPDSDDELLYDGDHLNLGDATVEQLALVLDLYPHKPDLEGYHFNDKESEEELSLSVRTSPFAALATLKDSIVSAKGEDDSAKELNKSSALKK